MTVTIKPLPTRVRTELQLPPTVKTWLEDRARENCTPISAEIVKLVKAEMAREQQKGVTS